jgi:2-dehydropantoate 2-reductase
VESERIYILGAGSIGMSLAAHLALSGRRVVAVRTSTDDVDAHSVQVTIHGSEGRTFTSPVEMISLARLRRLDGPIVVTAKSYANAAIAARLRGIETLAPLVIMQNGVGVEQPYLDLDGLRLYRCVLYATAQRNPDDSYTFMPVTASPIGIVRGDEQELACLVRRLHTTNFPFTALDNIELEVWKKATINSVFNSICPLLETDNGVFVRDARTAQLAQEVVNECTAVMHRLGFRVSAEDVMKQIFAISRRSDGQLISTLQDINHGRETEIDSLNLEIARIASTVAPGLTVSATRVLGEMVKIKSALRKEA